MESKISLNELIDFILKEEDKINELYEKIKNVKSDSEEVPSFSEDEQKYMTDLFQQVTEKLENLEIE